MRFCRRARLARVAHLFRAPRDRGCLARAPPGENAVAEGEAADVAVCTDAHRVANLAGWASACRPNEENPAFRRTVSGHDGNEDARGDVLVGEEVWRIFVSVRVEDAPTLLQL